MKEKSFYPVVEDFLRSESFACFKTSRKVGTIFVGNADVVGTRDIGGDARGDIEVVAVEVKLTTSSFGKILGQALGYSLFAHRCYLVIPFNDDTAFSIEQKELATGLGVGLIDIRRPRHSWRCVQVLTSANHVPNEVQVETLLRRSLKLFCCSFCGGVHSVRIF